VAVIRSLSALPLHVVCGLVMGGMIGPAPWQQHVNPEAGQWRLAAALLFPLVTHGKASRCPAGHFRRCRGCWPLRRCSVSNHALRTSGDADSFAGSPRTGALGVFLPLIGLPLVGPTILTRDLLTQQPPAG